MYKDVLSLYRRVHAGAKFLPEVALALEICPIQRRNRLFIGRIVQNVSDRTFYAIFSCMSAHVSIKCALLDADLAQ